MDITQLIGLSFIGLMTVGFVNVLTFFKPDMDSKVKFAASVVFAFALTFVPVEMGNVILEKVITALEAAAAMSGVYKLAMKAGGN